LIGKHHIFRGQTHDALLSRTHGTKHRTPRVNRNDGVDTATARDVEQASGRRGALSSPRIRLRVPTLAVSPGARTKKTTGCRETDGWAFEDGDRPAPRVVTPNLRRRSKKHEDGYYLAVGTCAEVKRSRNLRRPDESSMPGIDRRGAYGCFCIESRLPRNAREKSTGLKPGIPG